MSEPKSFYFLSRATSHEAKGSDEVAPTSSRTNGLEIGNDHDAEPTLSNWLTGFFRPKGYQSIREQKTRKVPTKVEPKVFFANERTFLAWLHMSVTLSTISIAIVAFAEANEFSQIYGLMLMPVAIAFCGYSLYMYVKRSSMIRRRHPGPCKLCFLLFFLANHNDVHDLSLTELKHKLNSSYLWTHTQMKINLAQ